ncbi:hypothetical protein RQP54_07535 [Curvibacter sp. APW13]|uniref:hypothetical protein n=1 Tax=Curvibacter sp. APW13 TaxID=3077236 RepID=UPI0028DFCE30|nr:hypothetical protein [Curvibacter sp. APW13]MDT8990716.1 hypothetical protein [Curvibacter sp. APW13]
MTTNSHDASHLHAVNIVTGIPSAEGVSSIPISDCQMRSQCGNSDDFSEWVQIRVIGIGRSGCQIVDRLYQRKYEEQCVQLIAIDVNEASLYQCGADKHIHLAASVADREKYVAEIRVRVEQAKEAICSAMRRAHMLFIVGEASDSTGNAAAPLIAKWASEMHIPNVGALIMPCKSDTDIGNELAYDTLNQMRLIADSVIEVSADDVRKHLHRHATSACISLEANALVSEAIRGVIDLVMLPGYVCVDFADVCSAFDEPDIGVIGIGFASGPDRAHLAAEQAWSSPLMGGIQTSQINALIAIISVAPGTFRLSEGKTVMTTILNKVSSETFFIYGARFNPSLGDRIQVTIIATGHTR